MSQEGVLRFGSSGSAVVQTITGNTGGPVGPDGSFNINLTANTTMGITTIGTPGTNSINILASQSTTSQFGTIKVATNAQALAGTDTANAITSDDLGVKLGTQTQFGVPSGGGFGSALSWTAAGVTGQLLAATTSGAPSFKALSIVIQTFVNTGTYTPTSGMVYCVIEAVGGGGGGGGAAATTGAQVSIGGGGGGGEYALGVFTAATIGGSQSVTIGAAGAANSGAAGGDGGNTSVGSTLISSNGGKGGATGAVGAATAALGGLGGTGGTGGSIRFPGQCGQAGVATVSTILILSGIGGSGRFGSGGINTIAFTSAGGAGLGNGSGGGGGGNYTSESATLGGVGTKGVVVVTEYVLS